MRCAETCVSIAQWHFRLTAGHKLWLTLWIKSKNTCENRICMCKIIHELYHTYTHVRIYTYVHAHNAYIHNINVHECTLAFTNISHWRTGYIKGFYMIQSWLLLRESMFYEIYTSTYIKYLGIWLSNGGWKSYVIQLG